METNKLLQRVYEATHSGLDIITGVCPEAAGTVGNNKKFRYRPDEKTPSACLKPPRDYGDCWHLIDYGGGEGEKRLSPIDVYMRDKGYSQSQFSLALHGLGEQTKSGSAFLVMAIVGNACVPQFTAYIMHQNETFYQVAYIVPLVCFAVCAYYGYKYKSLLKG